MKTVVVLGAGLVSRPIVDHLLSHGIRVAVADQDPAKAAALVAGSANGSALSLDANDAAALDALVAQGDLVVSLLPYTLHTTVARVCLKHRRDLVTTSYVSPAMAELDDEATAAGVLFLNECGLDPGIDHMSAMRVFTSLKKEGRKLTGFWSVTGGLPAPDANDNPWGYKFSWSPRGVLLAGRNAAHYLDNGKTIDIPGPSLFEHVTPHEVPGVGPLEYYPNRDAFTYIDTYGIHGVTSMFRGTFRYPGWCDLLRVVAALGLLDVAERPWPATATWNDVWNVLAPGQGSPRDRAAAKVNLTSSHRVFDALAWAGVFSDLPLGTTKASPLDLLCAVLQERMVYAPGERDLIVMEHRFTHDGPGGPRVRVSRLITYGEPRGDSAMARTVTLPTAVAVRLRLAGKLPLVGVRIPVVREVYEPVLTALEAEGIVFEEAEEPAAR